MGDVTIGIIGGVMGWMGDISPLGSSQGLWDGWVTHHHWDHRWGHGISGRHVTIGIIGGDTGSIRDITIGIIGGVME